MKHATLPLTVALLLASNVAFAEAGVPLDANAPDAADSDAPDAPPDAGPDEAGAEGGVPLACDGALCDTTNSGTCNVAPTGSGFGGVCAIAIGLSALVAAVARRRSNESR